MTRYRELHSCARALASRARSSPDSSKRIACAVTLRRSAAVMLSGTCRSTPTDLRFFRPPIWPSDLALSGLAWKKQSPPEPADGRQAAPVLVLPLQVFITAPILYTYCVCTTASTTCFLDAEIYLCISLILVADCAAT